MKRKSFVEHLPMTDATPRQVFVNRRRFLGSAMVAGIAGATGIGAASCQTHDGSASAAPKSTDGGDSKGQSASAKASSEPDPRIVPPNTWPNGFAADRNETYVLPKHADGPLTERLAAASHNNFYEFLPGRGGDVWPATSAFDVSTWSVELTGLCDNPMTLSLDDLYAIKSEERLLHFRCVERWAMNVPWIGFPLSRLIERAKPTSAATHVRFVSALRKSEMPGVISAGYYQWPYFEGLRMDEANNDMTFVTTGVYGDPLVKQHGAPIRLLAPWKYGYKGAKSIVKIEFIDEEPQTFWRQQQPREYGFISNVNPNIPHPRWSQERSYWIGTKDWFPTPVFNGYEEYVASMYPDEPTDPQDAIKPGQIAR